MRKNEEEQGTVFLRYGKTVLLGGGIGFCTGLLFLLLISLCISQGFWEIGLSRQLTVVGSALSGLIGGVFTVKQCRGQSLLLGLSAGAVSFLLQLSIGLLIFETFTFENGGLGLLCGALCGGAAASFLGGGKRSRPKRKKHYKH